MRIISALLLSLGICLCLSIHANGQTASDSLLQLIEKEKIDTIRLRHYLELIPIQRERDAENALRIGNKALGIARKLGDEKAITELHIANAGSYVIIGKYDTANIILQSTLTKSKGRKWKALEARSYMALSGVHEMLGDYDKGVRDGQRASNLYASMKDSIGWVKVQMNIGNNYLRLAKSDSALYHYNRCLEFPVTRQTHYLRSQALSNIAILYYHQKDYERALKYTYQACEFDQKTGNLNSLATDYVNLAVYYQFVPTGDDSVPHYLKKAITLFEEVGDNLGLSACLNGLGGYYNGKGNSNLALTYHHQGLALAQSIRNKLEVARLIASIGHDHKNLSNRDSAFIYLDSGMAMAQEMKNSNLELRLLNSYVEFHRYFKEFEQALDYSLLKEALGDSLYGIEKLKAIEELTTKYETEKKEQENQVLLLKVSRHNRTMVGIGVIAFLLVVVSIALAFAWKRDRKRHEAEVRSLLSEIELFKMKRKHLDDGILKPSVDYLDFDALNARLEEELDQNDMAVVRVWFEDYGLTRTQTAERLFISEDGLKSRMKNIREKLGVSGKQAAVKKIMEMLASN